jgi:hypothetical protein
MRRSALSISLVFKQFSVLRLGKFPDKWRNHREQHSFMGPLNESWLCRKANLANFPVSREFGPETGSMCTASSANERRLCRTFSEPGKTEALASARH